MVIDDARVGRAIDPIVRRLDRHFDRLARLERPRLFILTLVGLGIVLALWAQFAAISRVIRGEGRVVPMAHSQTVQYLEGGIVTDIKVREGQAVRKGEVLFLVDNLQARASLDQGEVKTTALVARAARLSAEAMGAASFSPPAGVRPDDPAVVAERATFLANRASLAQNAAVIQAQLVQRRGLVREAEARLQTATGEQQIARKQADILEGLLRQHAASRSEVLDAQSRLQTINGAISEAMTSLPRLRGSVAEGEANLAQLMAKAKADARLALAATQAELAQVNGDVRNQTDRVDRTVVRAPVSGIVNHIFAPTIGGVIKPAEPLLELTPTDGNLIIEARIRPADRGELRPGLPAKVKLTAYDYAVYGSLDGIVTDVSADTLPDESGQRFYQIKVRVNGRTALGPDKPIYPGMVVNVDVVVGQRTVAQYLLSPMDRFYRSAFREAH